GTDTDTALINFAWNSSNAGGKTHSVGWKLTNSAGLYDMSGNVWEWCFTASGVYRVVRGGSWTNNVGRCTVVDRLSNGPGSAYNDGGFRVVCR
ncbi:MAG: SUMF1/EgtB/PvdO family nonheme iron enzyme, partial [Spirochaetaceae bacterium]|nr:SUMF1/EgtB/PvdO family nonheme iron enzyme [Spirochaetaceae bacterium]